MRLPALLLGFMLLGILPATHAQDVTPTPPVNVIGNVPGCSSGQVYVVDESNPNATGCYSTGGGDSGGSPGQGGGIGTGGGGFIKNKSPNNPQTNPSAKPQKSKNPCADSKGVGEPIIPSTGNKVESVTDFALPGEMGLSFSRYYISRTAAGTGLGGWTSNLDYKLGGFVCPSSATGCTVVIFTRPDGSQISFQQSYTSAPGTPLTGPFTEIGGGGLATLTYTAPQAADTVATTSGSTPVTPPASPAMYTVVDEDAMTYTFTYTASNGGRLLSIKDPHGIGWTVEHALSGSQVTVIGTNGQSMTLVPSVQGTSSVLTVTDPAGNQYVYQSVAGNGGTSGLGISTAGIGLPNALASVSLPDGTTVSYKYQNPNPSDPTDVDAVNLTEVDYNGVAHDLTGYDSAGRANMSSLADGSQKVSILYGSSSKGPTATITNPLRQVSVYQYNAADELLSINGQAASHCAAFSTATTYDENENIASQTDADGNVTKSTYAANGQLQKKVEAAGTAVQRTTDYAWDPTAGTDRMLSMTVEGYRKTSYTYNVQNRLATVAVTNLTSAGTANQTLTTGYGYTLYSNGIVQAMTVTHPSPSNSNVDTYQYDTMGRVTSVTDGLGHSTTYGSYTSLNEPQHVVGPNGEITDFTYDTRGRIHTKTTYPNDTAAKWTYGYDVFGLLNTLNTPDGEAITWNRNAEGVLQTITHNDVEGTSTETFGYDTNNDITSDTATRNGVTGLSKSMSYDGLGRLYLVQGMHGQSQTLTYDGDGNVQSVTNAMGHVTSYTYDALNRVSSITNTGGASPPIPSTAPALDAPSSSNTGSYTVSWASVDGAVDYTLQQQINGGSWQTVEYAAATSWSAAGENNGTYGYRIRACNSTGCGPWSSTASVTVALAPTGAPSLSVPANSSSGAYTVSWNSVATATSYTLQEQANGGAWTSLQSSAATSMNLSGKGNGAYGYRAQACNSNGCGPWSAIVTITVLLPPQSAPSVSVPASSSNGAYTVSWSGVGTATSYTLQEQVSGGAWSTVQTNGTTSWSTSGRANASYGYRVQACNASGCGSWSSTATIAVTVIPQGPPSLSAPSTNSSGAYTVTWSGVSYATSYNLQEQVNGGSWSTVQSGGATSWGTSNRSAGTYGYKAQACNTYGCSGWSGIRTVTVNIPIALNGHSYTGSATMPHALPTPGKPVGSNSYFPAHGDIGVGIVSGNTWQVYSYRPPLSGTGALVQAILASGAIPSAATKVQFTWTYTGIPSGFSDGGGSVSNGASSPVAVSSNPESQYDTLTSSAPSTTIGRTYSVRVDFFNATGANISSSTCTLTAELESPQ